MQQYLKISDEKLIEMFRNGETQISEYLLDKYKDMVKKRARAMFLIGGETDDLIQEGMIGLFKAIQSYQEGKDASFQTFAKLCVERQIYTAIQNSQRQKHQPLNSYISLNSEEESSPLKDMFVENPESILIDQENEQTLKKEIESSLSSMENKVLNYYLAGRSYMEIAEMMEKSPKSIDNAIQRIKGKIRQKIKTYSN